MNRCCRALWVPKRSIHSFMSLTGVGIKGRLSRSQRPTSSLFSLSFLYILKKSGMSIVPRFVKRPFLNWLTTPNIYFGALSTCGFHKPVSSSGRCERIYGTRVVNTPPFKLLCDRAFASRASLFRDTSQDGPKVQTRWELAWT